MISADVGSASGFPAPQREAREPSELGRRIADRYQIERVSGEDASTVTVVARHLALEERVQVQVLRPEQRFDSQLSAQYLRAIKALARIKTDHVVRVLDVGVALYLGPFLVLEELEGHTLAELLRAEGPLPVPRAVEYVLQACKGLAVAHAAGIVHGQLHPSRLMLARRGEFETLKVIDFPTLEVPAAQRQPAYLAPELLSTPSTDRRVDVWSLGAVLFELVTGRSAFTPATRELAAHVLPGASAAGPAAGEPVLAQDAFEYDDPALTPALRAIIARCLQPDPELRFADVEALAAELMPLTTMSEVFRGSLTGSFSRQMLIAAAAQARATASATALSRAQQSSWRARLRRAAAAAPSLRRWSERWRALAQLWDERKPSGAPALQQALAGAGVLLLAVGSAAYGDLALTPPPPAVRGAAPSLAAVPAPRQAALSVVQRLEPAPAAPAAPSAAAGPPASAAAVAGAAEPAAAPEASSAARPPAVAGQPAAGLLGGPAAPARARPAALGQPPRAPARRASRATARKRAQREGAAAPKRRARRARQSGAERGSQLR